MYPGEKCRQQPADLRPHIWATSKRPSHQDKDEGPRWGAHSKRGRVPVNLKLPTPPEAGHHGPRHPRTTRHQRELPRQGRGSSHPGPAAPRERVKIFFTRVSWPRQTAAQSVEL